MHANLSTNSPGQNLNNTFMTPDVHLVNAELGMNSVMEFEMYVNLWCKSVHYSKSVKFLKINKPLKEFKNGLLTAEELKIVVDNEWMCPQR